jgi:hypothetical protein
MVYLELVDHEPAASPFAARRAARADDTETQTEE